MQRRIKSSLIPDEFIGCTFKGFNVTNQVQKVLYDTAVDYLKNFEEIRKSRQNSLGFMASVGEKRLNEIQDENTRANMKKKHNSYGLGKTHLQIAIAMHLIKKGLSVLVVNDVPFMQELTQAQFLDDEGGQLAKLMGGAKKADVLVWDDLGKKKSSEHKQNQYYEIIDHRWRNGLPICFTSNEDMDTLADKIGDAAASRLLSMCQRPERLLQVEGPDYRLNGGV